MKEELNVYNIPQNELFQFSSAGYYVCKVDRYSTRNGNYATDDAHEFTEVYRQERDDKISIVWSGTLIVNPHVFGKNGTRGDKEFSIFSGDMDTCKNFGIDMSLKEVRPEIAAQLEMPASRRTR